MFKNLATVHTDKIKTFVHLHKVKLNMLELHPHDHSACLSIKDPNNVQAADHTKRMQWTMDACCSDPDTLAVEREIQMLADLVLQGFCYLYLSVTIGLLACKQGMMRQPCTLNLGE